MLQTNLLTIAIPVYERIDFFQDALLSAINQTVKCEIIVVDNGSTHNTFKQICEEYKIEYHKSDRNIGMFPNWNRCFELSRTEYVFLLGDDDKMQPTFVEEFLQTKQAHPSIDVYFTDFDIYDHVNKKDTYHNHTYPFGYHENGDTILEYGILHGLGFPMISTIIKKSIFTGYYEKAHASNDWVWLYQNINLLTSFGHSSRLITRGHHQLNDSNLGATHMRCHLSIAYLYDYLSNNYNSANEKLRLYANEKSNTSLIYFLSVAPSFFLQQLILEDNIYRNFYVNKLETSFLYRILAKTPHRLKWTIYRVCRKLKLIQTP